MNDISPESPPTWSTSGPSDEASREYDRCQFSVGFNVVHVHELKRIIPGLQEFCGWCGKTQHGYRPRPTVEEPSRLIVRPEEDARQAVANFINDTGEYPFVEVEETYLVWFSKVLANWKALVIIRSKRGRGTVFDDLYFEVSHDGAKGSTYIDAYRKITNVEITDNRTPRNSKGTS